MIVVNDGSTDSTAKLIEQHSDLWNVAIDMPQNSGKGGAVLAALKRANGDFVLFQDADLEYSPSDYDVLLRPVLEFDADVVIGSRFLAPQWTRVSYFWHKIGNRLITLMFNVLNNTTFTDIYSCYLLYRRPLVAVEDIRFRGWEQHGEIVTLAVRRGKVLYEVPISYQGRTYLEGKKIRGRHALGIFWTLLFTRFRRA